MNLVSKKLQPWALLARSTLTLTLTLTPTLSRKRKRERERESEQVGSLSRVLVGEGWGEGDPPTG